MTLTVPYSKVLDRVKSSAYYVGEAAKNDLQDVAAQLQASEDDDDVLKDYLKEAATKCVHVIQHFVGTTRIETLSESGVESLLFTTQATANFLAEVGFQQVNESTSQHVPVAPNQEQHTQDEEPTPVEWPVEVPPPPAPTYIYPTGLSAAVEDYLTDYVLREWTKPIPKTSEHFNGKVTEDVQVIRTLAAHRKKPTRN